MATNADASALAASVAVRRLLRLYGKNALSFQTLGAQFRYWFGGDATCVAYVDTGAAWVAAGAPLCEDDRIAESAAAFASAASAHGRRTVWFAVEERFVSRCKGACLKVGEQPVWNPQLWAQNLQQHKPLLRQVRRPLNKGLVVERLSAWSLADPESSARRALADLDSLWLRSRRIRPLGFLASAESRADDPNKRVYWARVGPHPVAALHAVPVFGREGWLIERVPRVATAPNGTVECLMNTAMTDFSADGHTFATAGLTPLSGGPSGGWRAVRWLASPFYNFGGLRAFRERLRPVAWEPVYLAYEGGALRGTLAVWDALAAFAANRVWTFAAASLYHRLRQRGGAP